MAKIQYTEPAKTDLWDIEWYIHYMLENPIAANNTVDGIIETIDTLSIFPERCSLVNDVVLKRLGIRMTQYENYNIFYIANSRNDVVYILRVLYQRVDWQKLLKR